MKLTKPMKEQFALSGKPFRVYERFSFSENDASGVVKEDELQRWMHEIGEQTGSELRIIYERRAETTDYRSAARKRRTQYSQPSMTGEFHQENRWFLIEAVPAQRYQDGKSFQTARMLRQPPGKMDKGYKKASEIFAEIAMRVLREATAST